MEKHAIYDWLIGAPTGPSCDAGDAHVVASIIAMAAHEANAGRALTQGLGIAGAELRHLISALFPHALPLLERFGLDANVSIAEDEGCLRELLTRCSNGGTWLELRLAKLIARRSMRPNHLWQDLGLRNRRELSALMARHFAPLAARNNQDMKWKKFFFRMICRDEGFRLCAAPSCSECDDFAVCFGDESGESLLARIRHDGEPPVTIGAGSVWDGRGMAPGNKRPRAGATAAWAGAGEVRGPQRCE
jgi:nitrogen fixation protein NifQ